MAFSVQIAGILDESEARMLVDAGVDDLAFPVGPGVVTPDMPEDQVRDVIRRLPTHVGKVWVTYLEDPQVIVAKARYLGIHKIQLHGDVQAQPLQRLRQLAPELKLLKSVIIAPSTTLAELESQVVEQAASIDMFITDTFDPATGHRGATGKVHDWSLSAALVQISPKPVMLAGGLTPENVTEAVKRVRPAAVDAHTGVEIQDGRKDPQQVRLFVQRAKSAARALGL